VREQSQPAPFAAIKAARRFAIQPRKAERMKQFSAPPAACAGERRYTRTNATVAKAA